MTKAAPSEVSSSNPKPVDPVEEASEESFPASDSPAWNASKEAAPAPSPPPPVEADDAKKGCAVSFLMEERDEMDKLCERTPAEQRESYTEPEEEKEVGGQG